MCSINGCTGYDPFLVEAMNAATKHRGPDDTGVWSDGHVTLGNNRLAIIDLSPHGHQPMESADGRYVIAFNGEIYNFHELRAELSSYSFKSESDTEVLLAGFTVWRTGLFEKLNGMFAFAIWDKKEQELFLARDRMGIKPLYLLKTKYGVIFSSEIKAILASSEAKKRLSSEAFAKFLRVGYTPDVQTLFEGIERLPAGTFMRIAGGSTQTTPYVSFSRGEQLTGEAAREQLRATVDAAVKRQLVSDRPLGVYLSGGIDSSIVLDAMSRVHGSIDTYSVGYDVAKEEYDKFNADFLIARKTATRYGSRHHEYLLGTDDLRGLLEDAVYHLDEPVGNATVLAQLALSRFAKESVTVVLGGDGGDELFGGYPRYSLSGSMDRYQKFMPRPVWGALAAIPSLAKFATPPGARRYALFHFIKDPLLREVAPRFATETLERATEAKLASYGGMEFDETFLRLDREWWLQDEALLRSDKMTMAAGVEGRVPLLDNEVVALADRIPVSEKIKNGTTKWILREAFRGRLPEYLFEQPKRGWFSPGAKWLRDERFGGFVRETLAAEYHRGTANLFDWDGIQRVLQDHVERRRYNAPVIWEILMFQVWARTFDVTA